LTQGLESRNVGSSTGIRWIANSEGQAP